MTVAFQADADFNGIVIRAILRLEPSVDFRSALELAGLDDLEVLAAAAEAERILVTHDQRTMPRHFGQFISNHRSPGVLIVPQSLPVRAVADELLLIWAATEPDDWVNRIVVLPI